MATLIRATCGDCGNIELGTRDVVVRLCEADDSGTYVFRCPRCAFPVVHPADRSTIDLLVSAGVRLEVWSMPAELTEPRPFGEPFAYDDLIDFHNMLSGNGWFDELLDTHRRRQR
jgi:hypothetical protein